MRALSSSSMDMGTVSVRVGVSVVVSVVVSVGVSIGVPVGAEVSESDSCAGVRRERSVSDE